MSDVTGSRHYARLLLMMRRLVKEEFAVTVRLGDEDAPEELLAFASRSRHHLLRQMATELEEQLGGQPGEAKLVEPPTSSENVTYYRGAPIVREEAVATEPQAKVTATKRVYRGQIVG